MIKKFFITATVCLIVFLSNSLVFSQEVKATISVSGGSKIRISLVIENDDLIDRNLFFLQSYADAERLGERINAVQLFGVDGKEISYKTFAEGEFVAEEKIKRATYFVNAGILTDLPANAHISWMNGFYGLIMPNDLFPKFKDETITADITFQMSPDLKVIPDAESSVIKEDKEFLKKRSTMITTGYSPKIVEFNTQNLKKAVFVIGNKWRKKEISVKDTSINFLLLDEWQFSDELAFEMAGEIMREYADLFGEIPFKKVQIVLMGFPKQIEYGRWRAETRGANITILSSQAFATSFAKQRLHEQLRHEIFHLWIPNSLKLSGDYAWFYEGFAIYQALKTGVNLGQIRFEDFLNTLEQAYFLNRKRSNTNSLIDISKMRWNGEVSSVYAKGMLVAFLCDAAILQKSRGKRDLRNVFREIYLKFKGLNVKPDANESILEVLQDQKELETIINLYIKGTDKIDWAKYLSVFGIENIGTKTSANLRLKSKLSGRQKALLKKLGYNRRRNFNRRNINKN